MNEGPQRPNSKMEDIILGVKRVAAEVIGVPAEQQRDEDHFRVDLNADSLAMYELRLALEQHFDILIDDEDVIQLTTVQGAAEYIAQILLRKE